MKKLLAIALCGALMTAAPANLIAVGRVVVQGTGAISGVASVDGKALGNVTVRLRNVDTGQLVGNTTANAQGQFSFAGLPAGNFVVETVAANGTILGTSTTVALTAAAMAVTGVAVTTSGAALAAAGGAAAAGAGAASGGAAAGAAAAGGSFFATTAGIVTIAAVGAGVATAVAVAKTGS